MTRSGDEIWIGQNVQLLIEGVEGRRLPGRGPRHHADASARRRRSSASGASSATWSRTRRWPWRSSTARARSSPTASSGCTLWRLAASPLPVRRHADVLPAVLRGGAHAQPQGPGGLAKAKQLVERPDGSAVYVTWAVHPWRGPGGEVAGAVAVAQDIDVLVRARQAAQETSRVKSEFLANVSHELRTPLNGVLGMARLLLDTTLDTTQHGVRGDHPALRARAPRSGGRDPRLRPRRGRPPRAGGRRGGRRRASSRRSALRWRSEAAAKGLHVTSLVAEEVPRRLRGDAGPAPPGAAQPARQRHQVHAVGNGGGAGGAGARIQRRPTVLRFEVADTGIGLDAATQARLFQPFVQADGSATRPYGGAGLGLALCRRIVSAMGGQIGVRSEPGQGSTFWFTVRLSRRRTRPRAATEPDVRRGGRVLVVEDNTVNQKVAVAMIESLGYGAEAVGNGVEAVEACDAPDLRRDPDGLPDAADGRLQGHRLHPPARGPHPPHARSSPSPRA